MTYSIETDNLNNYLKIGGIIFFVVEIVDVTSVKIYYANLLPVDIKVLLDNSSKDQKFKSFHLYELNENHLTFYELCKNFLQEQKKQRSTVDYMSVNMSRFKTIDFEVSTTPNRLLTYLFHNPVYTYGIVDEHMPKIPIGKMQVKEIDRYINQTVSCEDKIYFNNFIVVVQNDQTITKIGNNIRMVDSTSGIEFQFAGNLSERINDIKFLLHISQAKKFKLGESIIEITNCGNTHNYRKYLELLLNIEAIISFFNVRKQIDIEKLSGNDCRRIYDFSKLLFYGNDEKHLILNSGFYRLKFSNICILFMAIKEESKVEIVNPFSESIETYKLVCSPNNDPKTAVNVTPLLYIKADYLCEIDNYDSQTVINAISKMKLSGYLISMTNNFTLELLNAFDISNNRQFVLTAIQILNILSAIEPTDPVNILNIFQSQKRITYLSKNQIHTLNEMKEKYGDDPCMSYGINILLENYDKAKESYNNMNKKQQDEYKNYPITHLMK